MLGWNQDILEWIAQFFTLPHAWRAHSDDKKCFKTLSLIHFSGPHSSSHILEWWMALEMFWCPRAYLKDSLGLHSSAIVWGSREWRINRGVVDDEKLILFSSPIQYYCESFSRGKKIETISISTQTPTKTRKNNKWIDLIQFRLCEPKLTFSRHPPKLSTTCRMFSLWSNVVNLRFARWCWRTVPIAEQHERSI